MRDPQRALLQHFNENSTVERVVIKLPAVTHGYCLGSRGPSLSDGQWRPSQDSGHAAGRADSDSRRGGASESTLRRRSLNEFYPRQLLSIKSSLTCGADNKQYEVLVIGKIVDHYRYCRSIQGPGPQDAFRSLFRQPRRRQKRQTK